MIDKELNVSKMNDRELLLYNIAWLRELEQEVQYNREKINELKYNQDIPHKIIAKGEWHDD